MEFTGASLLLTWAYSGGTIALSGDSRNCDWNPTSDFAEGQAGSDSHKSRLKTLLDATAAVTLVAQTGGTAISAALQPGTNGTLTIQPEGTATNKQKITFPSLSQGAQSKFPYADVVEISCSFVGNGPFTDGVN